MATAAHAPRRLAVALPSTRMVEWSILVLVMLVVALVAGHHVQILRAQAERSTVLSTLGALRTGLVIAHLQVASANPAVSARPVPKNPFKVLQTMPLNYRGEFSVNQSLAASLSGWVYDPQCTCVGYLPLDSDWSDGTSAARALWFKVDAGPGPRQLKAQGTYLWRGVLVQ